jgi:hypothetical protein
MTDSVAFYAPMKPPDHPMPSGDRRIARLMQRALERAGFGIMLASRLRTWEGVGDPVAQATLADAARAEADRLIAGLATAPPALWFTYHCYWKAPDLVGPRVAASLNIPYAIAEGARSPRRRQGAWAGFAAAADAALDAADVVFWLTERDLPELESARPTGQRLVRLRPFTALGQPAARPVSIAGPLRLVAVAMMRPGDKIESYRALGAALLRARDADWRLTVVGAGPAEAEARAALAPVADRTEFVGRRDDRPSLHAEYEAADLLVWPGVNEGVGMVYLEAQAAGRACVAEYRPGVRDVLAPSCPMVAPGDAEGFAAAIRRFAEDRDALAAAGAAARAHMLAHHGIRAAAATLRDALAPLLAR